ncbi:MAG: hypothetical protein H0X51_01865 [Parachlamydiaceae bacterium]|nr:hypothetical protein [Parachlamydiaceae bacterium]
MLVGETHNHNHPTILGSQQISTTGCQKVQNAVLAVFWTLAIVVDPVIDFFTQGISDFLALDTLRHGTNFSSYINIRVVGPEPSRGGGEVGASMIAPSAIKNSKGYFHVSPDSTAQVPGSKYGGIIITRFFASRLYCGISAASTIKGKGMLRMAWRIVVVVLSILIIPTIKFRFRPEDVELKANTGIFEDDPDSTGTAYRTKHIIGMTHIGLKGIVTQGFDGDVFARMRAHPIKVTWGLAKLINPIGIPILIALGVTLAIKSTLSCCRTTI